MTKIPGMLRPLAKPLAPIGEMAKFRLKPTIRIANATGQRFPFRFDGYQDMSILGRGMQPQFTAMREIPGFLTNHSTTYGSTLSQRGYQLPNHLPNAEVLDALRTPVQPALNPMQQVRQEYLRQAIGV